MRLPRFFLIYFFEENIFSTYSSVQTVAAKNRANILAHKPAKCTFFFFTFDFFSKALHYKVKGFIDLPIGNFFYLILINFCAEELSPPVVLII
jgi:hypothetical protein